MMFQGMFRSKVKWASLSLVALSLAGLCSLYQVMFDVWMTAYPYANPTEWRARFYIRLTTTIVIGFLWSFVALWLFRQRHR
ncbi:hypothetical protein HDF12_001750 [Edaphobacter lichenicola]|uniref:Uncharacterized protein n=1 Tax=Tunturiibacter lichenicola TaxID=2051959 RepID=A0A7Y9NL54_9BACT|nr:hypothetical protein [Edaphobacter lichenicola]